MPNMIRINKVGAMCAFAVLAFFVHANPDTVIPESTQALTPEFSQEVQFVDDTAHQEATVMMQEKGADACQSLADASKKSVEDAVKAEQDVLNAAVKNGATCPEEGKDLVTEMKALLATATQAQATAQQELNAAQIAPVNFGTKPFGQIAVQNGCAISADTTVYKDVQKKVDDAKMKLIKADGAVKEAKVSVATAEKSAKDAVKKCQCKTYEASVKAQQNANGKFAKDNADTWTKAANLECVLAGKGATDCKVPPLPVVKAPTLAAGIDEWSCKTETRSPTGAPTFAPTASPTPPPTQPRCAGIRVYQDANFAGNNAYFAVGTYRFDQFMANGRSYGWSNINDQISSVIVDAGCTAYLYQNGDMVGAYGKFTGPWRGNLQGRLSGSGKGDVGIDTMNNDDVSSIVVQNTYYN